MIPHQSISRETSKGVVYTAVNRADNKRRTLWAEGGHRGPSRSEWEYLAFKADAMAIDKAKLTDKMRMAKSG